jgi:two-component system phosphate regulon response regulator OmpR
METRPTRILIVDDEAELRALLQRYLSEQGLEVRAVSNARDMDRYLVRETFDLLILDVALPVEDGLAICRRLRAAGDIVPIIMLTARGEPLDRILGLEMGADDYLPKPFNPRELLARIQAQLRRQSMAASGSVARRDEIVSFGPWRFDLASLILEKSGTRVSLTSSELALLRSLALHRGRPLGRERLLEMAKGRSAEITDRSIDVQVMRLRRLLEEDPAKPIYLRTVWGVGYQLVAEAG